MRDSHAVAKLHIIACSGPLADMLYEISNVKSVSAKGLMFSTTSPFVGYSGFDKFYPPMLKSLPPTLALGNR